MMKKRILYIAALLFTLSLVDAGAQNVVMNAYMDTMQMRIGEQTKIRVEMSIDSGYAVPVFDVRNIPEKIEILETKNEVIPINEGKRNLYKNEYLITSFDSTTYYIPPFKAMLDDQEYHSNELLLAVYSVPIDTVNIHKIAPPKSIWAKEITWEEMRDSVYLGFLVLLFAVLLVWVIIRLAKNKPIIRIIKLKPRIPSHISAKMKMEEIKSDNTWRVDGDNKRYYTMLTDVLREYMCERFGFNATEMTTPEIVLHLKNITDKESLKELQEVLEIADLVKFAKLAPAMNENDRNFFNAMAFIERTKNVEEEKLPQRTEKRVVSKRTVWEKRTLIASIITIALLFTAVAVLLVFDLNNLLA